MIKTLFFIGIGSFLGGVLRYLLSRWVQLSIFSSYPLGTLIVNILGCFAIGVFYALFERGNLMNANLKMFLTVGLCGGFTTYSTFINDNFQLVRNGELLNLCTYTTISLVGGFLMLYAGYSLVKLF